ncbi:MAG: hypothetical protein OXD38_15205, partial [Aestuariivita sp.]|nr:hypothetical protein [Aestuariivita sp.]
APMPARPAPSPPARRPASLGVFSLTIPGFGGGGGKSVRVHCLFLSEFQIGFRTDRRKMCEVKTLES